MRSFWIIWISLFLSKRGAFNIRISCLLLKPSARVIFVVDTLLVAWPCIYISMLEEEDLCFASFGSTVLNVLSYKRTRNNLSKIHEKRFMKNNTCQEIVLIFHCQTTQTSCTLLFSSKLSIWSALNKENDVI